MNITVEMKCRCRDGIEVSLAEYELARRLELDPEDVHKFMDEWIEASGEVERRKREERAAK